MVVKIRLARFGVKNKPFYNIVVAQARSARNSRPMEVLGTYDPAPKEDVYEAASDATRAAVAQYDPSKLVDHQGRVRWPTPEVLAEARQTAPTDAAAEPAPQRTAHKDVQLDVLRAKYWIGVGAQPTDTAWRILAMAGILDPKRSKTPAA